MSSSLAPTRTIAGRPLHQLATGLLAAVTAAGLAYDAYVHADLAGNYDAIKTSTLSQGNLFRTEAALAALAAALVLFRPRRYTAAFATVVAGGGLIVLLAYRYWNIGQIGPLPSMYEPVWYPEKTRCLIAEAIAAGAGLALFVIQHVHARAVKPGYTDDR